MTDMKALRALLDAYTAGDEHAGWALRGDLLSAAPDLLALAEAVRDLAPLLVVPATMGSDPTERDAARRVLAILDTPPRAAGDDR